MYKSGAKEEDWVHLATVAYERQNGVEVVEDGHYTFAYWYCLPTFQKPSNTRLIAARDAAKKGSYMHAYYCVITCNKSSTAVTSAKAVANKMKQQAERRPIGVKAAKEQQRCCGKQLDEANHCG